LAKTPILPERSETLVKMLQPALNFEPKLNRLKFTLKSSFFTRQQLLETGKQLFERAKNKIRHWPKTSAALGLVLLAWIFCLPRPLFQKPLSTVLEDRNGELLGARIAADGQWRSQPAIRCP